MLLISGDFITPSDFNINIEEVFPAPGMIVKDIFELYTSNKPTKERELALLNYVKLLFKVNLINILLLLI